MEATVEDNLMDTTILTSNKSVPVPKGKIINEVEVEETYACIIVEEESVEPSEIREALKELGFKICSSTDGKHLPEEVPDECDMIFVMKDFEGPVFKRLKASGMRILGFPAVLASAKRNKPLPTSTRPVFSCTMEGTVVCFTGFKDKDELHALCNKVHLMGGSIRKEMTSSVTHVVAHAVNGSKYKVAVGLGTPIMSEAWIESSWEKKTKLDVFSFEEELMQCKQHPFAGCTIAFLGFTEEEEDHMKEVAQSNGAEVKELGSSGVTHLVVASELDVEDIPVVSSRVSVVKVQWFWESIQIEACVDEALYLAKDAVSKKKRKRQSMAMNGSCDRSGIDASLFSVTSSSLCSLSTPTKTEACASSETIKSPKPVSSARHHIASELLQTERNYVNILQIIVKVFKEPLENPSMRGGPVLDREDVKCIFANIEDILHVHERIMGNLSDLISNWSDETCIGITLVKEAEVLMNVYPKFINFFEISKETLQRCDKQYPRFHAFLKAKESEAECARQTIVDLLITPIQRLPRIILLLQDLTKHTGKDHEDYINLQKALEGLRDVMTHINEDKRKTEGQVQMFEILRDVEDCPANILSSSRSFVGKIDVVDIASHKGSKGELLTLFLFTDSIEIAKKRNLSTFNRTSKQYRHIQFLSLMHCSSIVSFSDADDMFGLLVKWPSDPEHEKLLVFRQLSEEMDTHDLIMKLCRQIANLNYNPDHENFLLNVSSESVLGPSSVKKATSSAFKKALSGARKKVKRAFSTRTDRKPFVNLPLNLQATDESVLYTPSSSPTGRSSMLEPPDSPGNQSIVSTTSMCMFTSVQDLRTPQPKRAAVTRSFGASDRKSYFV